MALGLRREIMKIKVLHLSDIHLGSTTHGKVNPQTGLNTRLEDFVAALPEFDGDAHDRAPHNQTPHESAWTRES